jgi:hypothetical protein
VNLKDKEFKQLVVKFTAPKLLQKLHLVLMRRTCMFKVLYVFFQVGFPSQELLGTSKQKGSGTEAIQMSLFVSLKLQLLN